MSYFHQLGEAETTADPSPDGPVGRGQKLVKWQVSNVYDLAEVVHAVRTPQVENIFGTGAPLSGVDGLTFSYSGATTRQTNCFVTR